MLFTIVCHGVAMLAMILFLLPGMPGVTAEAQRTAYVRDHAFFWRLGWLPWHLTALSDLLLSLALVRTSWVPRFPAWGSLVLTVVALAFEQPAEFRWGFEGPAVAAQGVSQYLAFESDVFRLTSLWAALFYALAAIAWSVTFARAGTWNRFLTWLSIPTWGIFVAFSIGPLLLSSFPTDLISKGSAIGFVLMMLWFVVVTELVMRRSRPDAGHGRLAPWRLPFGSPLSVLLNAVGNSRLLRTIGEFLPTPPIVSDITDVIFVNYLVEADQLKPCLPEYLELQTVGQESRHGLFTILIYNHGHVGPRFLGSLRRFLPSPVQSNWRIYVRDPQTGVCGVYFVATTVSSVFGGLVTRITTEGLPNHVPESAKVTALDGTYQAELVPGSGTSPDLSVKAELSSSDSLPISWSECFSNYRTILEFVVPQERSLSSEPWDRRVTRQEIRLGIPVDECVPLASVVQSSAAKAIVGDTEPVCFHVPNVTFHYDKQVIDRRR